MSSEDPAVQNAPSAGSSVPAGSLRSEMEARRTAGERFTLREAVGIVVPLCVELARLHEGGKTLFVHPSTLKRKEGGGIEIFEDQAHSAPSLARDRACLAPEERKGTEGDARASVFTVGAVLYELLTNESVGPGMRRPADLVPDLPAAVEVVLGKALVADPKHRPHDLAALASALYHIAPSASLAPPDADESHLDHDGDFEVDVSLSMIPPSQEAKATAIPKAPAVPKLQALSTDGPFPVAVRNVEPKRNENDPTQRLSDLKERLESDPRSRYVVIKDGMDHGPFSAVEVLQQIASHTFVGDHALRDDLSSEVRAIKDWDEFAPFAEQAKLNRDIVHEKAALEVVVAQEKKGAQYKALIGAAVVGIIASAGAGIWFRDRQNKERALEVQGGERVASIEIDGGFDPSKSPGAAGGRAMGGPVAGGGNYPVIAGGSSCEAAQARYVEDYSKLGNTGPADLTAGAYGAVLNRGSYLNACGVPSNMEVSVCAAVQNGRAVGVTVTTSPPNPGISSCVAGQVRSLSFPSHPRLDVARTTFSAN